MKKTTTAVAAIAALVLGSAAFGTSDIMKVYKKEKDPKANCASCHTDKAPKKESHGLNETGEKVKGATDDKGKIDWSKVPAVEQK